MGKGAVRTVTNSDCFLLTETAALIIALAIDEQSPATVRTQPTGPRPRVGDSERPPAIFGQTGTVAPATTRRLPFRSGPPMRFRAGVIFGAETGSLPKQTTGMGLGVGMHVGWFEITGSGWYWMERAAPAMQPQSGGNVSLFYGELRACANLNRAGQWGLCAIGDAGWMRVKGYGVDNPLTSYSAMFSIGWGAQWSVEIKKHVYFRIAVQSTANLTRPLFVFQPGNEPVHQPSNFSARASAGVEMLIW